MKRVIIFAAAFAAFGGTGATAHYLGPVAVAAVHGDAAEVRRLLQAGHEPDAAEWLGLTPLSAAMRSCRVTADVVAALVAAGADLEARSGVGATPLMLAWQTGRPDLAKLLVEAGADPDAENLYGDTAEDYRRYFSGELAPDAFATLRYTSLGFPPREGGTAMTHCAE